MPNLSPEDYTKLSQAITAAVESIVSKRVVTEVEEQVAKRFSQLMTHQADEHIRKLIRDAVHDRVEIVVSVRVKEGM